MKKETLLDRYITLCCFMSKRRTSELPQKMDLVSDNIVG